MSICYKSILFVKEMRNFYRSNLEILFQLLDYHIYEGTWTRSKDGASISCSFRFDGKLKCQWDENSATNIIAVTNASLIWDRDPNVTGTYSNGTITWSNGSVWEKVGKY